MCGIGQEHLSVNATKRPMRMVRDATASHNRLLDDSNFRMVRKPRLDRRLDADQFCLAPMSPSRLRSSTICDSQAATRGGSLLRFHFGF
jgi:hypothetical protein